MLGAATYFSATSQYSAGSTFSPPNNNGEKFMIMAKVITGDYCKGDVSLKCAPYKKDQKFEQYDSVVDDESKPTMYAVFHDAAAYPEYIIKFKQASVEVVNAVDAAGAAGAVDAAGAVNAAGAANAADIAAIVVGLQNLSRQSTSTYSGQGNSDPSCCVL